MSLHETGLGRNSMLADGSRAFYGQLV